MKKWQFWLGVLISIVFIWLALRGLRLDEFWGAVKQANYFWLVPGIAVYFVMTEAAAQFITPMTLQALSGNPVLTGLW